MASKSRIFTLGRAFDFWCDATGFKLCMQFCMHVQLFSHRGYRVACTQDTQVIITHFTCRDCTTEFQQIPDTTALCLNKCLTYKHHSLVITFLRCICCNIHHLQPCALQGAIDLLCSTFHTRRHPWTTFV